MIFNEEQVIQQLRRKKTLKYPELKYVKQSTKNQNDVCLQYG